MATTITFQTLLPLLHTVAKDRKPILIRGAHGCGKSELVYQMAKTIGSALGLGTPALPVVERRASQMPDAGDIMGLPYEVGEVTKFKKMEWLHQACVEPVVLFFDEIDRANRDVRQALFELTDSRKIAGHTLHSDTVVIACVNSGETDNGYLVEEFGPAELDRWTVFDVEPSVEDFLLYAKDKIDSVIWDFLKENPSHLEHKGQFAPNKKYPSRRSWVRLGSVLEGEEVLENLNDKNQATALFYLAQGFVGEEAAISFQDYAKNYERQLTVEDIFMAGKTEQAKVLDANQHINIIDKLSEHKLVKKKLSAEVMKNIGKYIMVIPAELTMMVWRVVSNGYPENSLDLYNLEVDGVKIKNLIADINGSLDEK